jgi:hypothetical protein
MIINLPRVKKVRFLILKTLFATILTLSVVTAQLRSQDFGDVRPPAFLTQRDLERQATAVKNTEIQRETEMHRMQIELQKLELEKMRLRAEALKRLPAITTQLSEIIIEPNINDTDKLISGMNILSKNADIANIPEVSSAFDSFYKAISKEIPKKSDPIIGNFNDQNQDLTISNINDEFQNFKRCVSSLESSISYFDHEETEDSLSDIDDNFRKIKRAFSTLESTVPLVSSETKIFSIKNAIDDISSRLRTLGYEVDDFDHDESEDSLSEIEHEFNRLKRAVTDCEFYL